MRRSNREREVPRKKCNKCGENSGLYTANEMKYHQRKEHQQVVEVSRNGRTIVFYRDGDRFPCACGRYYKCQSLKKHALKCEDCGSHVSNMRPRKRIEIRAQPVEYL